MKKTYYNIINRKYNRRRLLPVFLWICVSLGAVFICCNAYSYYETEGFSQKKNIFICWGSPYIINENKTAGAADKALRVNHQHIKKSEVVMPPKTQEICLDVENILQLPDLPNGCEVVSLAILLKYAGYSVDPVKLYDSFMPKSPYLWGDPQTTYVGNAKAIGIGCYAPCVVTTGNSYLSSVGSVKKVINVSGVDMNSYKKLLARGIPVMIWGLIDMNCNDRIGWEEIIDGCPVRWLFYSHCLVLIGYTENTYIFCDPLKGKIHYSKTDVEKSFLLNRQQACIIQ